MALLPFASPRSRVVAERAASMRPAFRTTELESEIASGMPVPAWNGFANHRDSPAAFEGGENVDGSLPESVRPEEPREVTSDVPTALDVAPPREAPAAGEGPPAGRSRTLRWVGVATLGAAALLVFLTIVVAAPSQPQGQSAAGGRAAQVMVPAVARPEVAPAAETLAPLRQTPPAPELLELRVRAFPASARILVDGTPVGENPFRGSYPKDGASHRITVRADGYETKNEDVTLSKDMVVDISLNRSAARPVFVGAAPATAPRNAKRAAAAAPVAAAPVAAAQQPPIASAAVEVDSAGGRLPLRPIETKDPYAAH